MILNFSSQVYFEPVLRRHNTSRKIKLTVKDFVFIKIATFRFKPVFPHVFAIYNLIKNHLIWLPQELSLRKIFARLTLDETYFEKIDNTSKIYFLCVIFRKKCSLHFYSSFLTLLLTPKINDTFLLSQTSRLFKIII